MNDRSKCCRVSVRGSIKRETQDDGCEILVDNSENEMAEALVSTTDGMISQDEADEQIETAVAETTEDLYTQEEYDAKSSVSQVTLILSDNDGNPITQKAWSN